MQSREMTARALAVHALCELLRAEPRGASSSTTRTLDSSMVDDRMQVLVMLRSALTCPFDTRRHVYAQLRALLQQNASAAASSSSSSSSANESVLLVLLSSYTNLCFFGFFLVFFSLDILWFNLIVLIFLFIDLVVILLFFFFFLFLMCFSNIFF